MCVRVGVRVCVWACVRVGVCVCPLHVCIYVCASCACGRSAVRAGVHALYIAYRPYDNTFLSVQVYIGLWIYARVCACMHACEHSRARFLCVKMEFPDLLKMKLRDLTIATN